MAQSVKEEQVSVRVGLHQHHNASSNDCKKADDVHNANAVEYDVPSTRESLR